MDPNRKSVYIADARLWREASALARLRGQSLSGVITNLLRRWVSTESQTARPVRVNFQAKGHVNG